LASQLDAVQGIGPSKRKALLQTFGDLEGIRQADLSELTAVSGISRKLAERLKAQIA
jgi:excinuclease ABC subunit C